MSSCNLDLDEVASGRLDRHLVVCSCCRHDLLTDIQAMLALEMEPWPGHLCRSVDGGWRCARTDNHDGTHASHGWAHTWS